MAEFVNEAVDKIATDLSTVKCLSIDEKSQIVKKSTRYEYRIRKRTKTKEDLDRYIEYEKALLALLKVRKAAANSKKALVPFIRKIHELYQLYQQRFSEHIDAWLQHIAFCSENNEHGRVSRIYKQMLGYHSNKPELWLQAAVWEVERHQLPEARSLMQQCVQINRLSRLAWAQFYKLELRIAKEEVEPNGKLADIIRRNALREFEGDLDMLLLLIEECRQYKFVTQQKEAMIHQLKEKFCGVPRAWDFLARLLMPRLKKKKSCPTEEQEEQLHAVYQEAVTQAPGTEMWTLYLKACLELLTVPKLPEQRLNKRVQRTLEVFQEASDRSSLSEEMFQAWVLLLKDGLQMQEARDVCQRMTDAFPASPLAWNLLLALHFQARASPQDVVTCLNKALRGVPEVEAWGVWEPALHYLAAVHSDQLEPLLQRACQKLVAEVSEPAKLLYLRWTALNSGIKATRKLYDKLSVMKPVPLTFYTEYVQQELMQDKVKMKKVRRAFEDAVNDYGANEPDVWLQYIQTELTCAGEAQGSAGDLYARAKLHLHREARDTFIQRYGAVVSVC